MTYELNISPKHYNSILNGRNFLIMKNDNDLQVGDILLLHEYETNNDMFADPHTGRICTKQISYICPDTESSGLKTGYYILGLEDLKSLQRKWI